MRECRICGEIDNIIRCGGHYKNNEKRQVYMCKNCGYSWVSDEQFIRDDRFRLPIKDKILVIERNETKPKTDR